MRGESHVWTAPTHPIIVREQRQRQTTSSMWITITSVVVGGTDWTTGQPQSTGLQWTNTDGHTWTGQWRLQSSSCPVWIHSRQDQQEQRLHLLNQRSTKTQTCLPVGGKSRWNRPDARRIDKTWQQFSARCGRYVYFALSLRHNLSRNNYNTMWKSPEWVLFTFRPLSESEKYRDTSDSRYFGPTIWCRSILVPRCLGSEVPWYLSGMKWVWL